MPLKDGIFGWRSALRPVPALPTEDLIDGNSLTAAASIVDIAALAKKRKVPDEEEWQREAWRHYNRSGELQFAGAWMANSLSRVRIYAAEVGEDGRPGKPTDNAQAKKIAADMFGGPDKATQIMAALGVHLVVPGDCYVVVEEKPDGDQWSVISRSELAKRDGKLGLFRDGEFHPLDAKKTLLIRVFNRHPQHADQATSATRSVLPVLRELEKLDQHVYATLESRLPNGILFVPNEIDFISPDPEIAAANGSTGALMQMLVEYMMAAVEDRESPASLAPLLAKVPGEVLDKVHLVEFGSDLIERIAEMREAGIRRLALGLDMPPEQLLGLGDSNHWSSWQIEEGGVKVHVEPKALTIVSALTETYFRPALRAAGIADPEAYTLWYDVTELVLRPNRQEAAKDLHAGGSLADAVLMREAGFDPDHDRPDDAEFRRRVLLNLLDKKPDFAPDILPALGITDVTFTRTAPAPDPAEPGTPESERDRSGDNPQAPGKGNPGSPKDPGDSGSPAQKGKTGTRPGEERAPRKDSGGKADIGDAVTFAREVAVESLVSRGLEFANKKLLTRGRRGTFDGDIRSFYLDPSISVSREQLPRLLDGAWTYLAEIAEMVGLDPARLERSLLDHVGGLLVTGQEHTRRYSRTIAAHCVAVQVAA